MFLRHFSVGRIVSHKKTANVRVLSEKVERKHSEWINDDGDQKQISALNCK